MTPRISVPVCLTGILIFMLRRQYCMYYGSYWHNNNNNNNKKSTLPTSPEPLSDDYSKYSNLVRTQKIII